MANVGKYTIHGSYGKWRVFQNDGNFCWGFETYPFIIFNKKYQQNSHQTHVGRIPKSVSPTATFQSNSLMHRIVGGENSPGPIWNILKRQKWVHLPPKYIGYGKIRKQKIISKPSHPIGGIHITSKLSPSPSTPEAFRHRCKTGHLLSSRNRNDRRLCSYEYNNNLASPWTTKLPNLGIVDRWDGREASWLVGGLHIPGGVN